MSSILSFKPKAGQSAARRRTRFSLLAAAISGLLLTVACDPGQDARAKAPPAAACDLNAGPCETITPWGKMQLTLAPQPVPVLKPIELTLRFAADNGAQGRLTLNGAEMEMGTTSAELVRVDARTLRGSLIIPMCLTGAMQWQLRFDLSDGTQQATPGFTFFAPVLSATRPH
jgi:hypothetical protein